MGRKCLRYTDVRLVQSFPELARRDQRRRQRSLNWITFISADLDRPGLSPYIWDPAGSDGSTVYGAATGGGIPGGVPTYPKAGLVPYPAIATVTGTPPTNSEFDATTRCSNLQQTLAALTPYAQAGKLDLSNWSLTPFPAADPTTGAISTTADTYGRNGATGANSVPDVQDALLDRQTFAKDIYNLLKTVTGCPAPGTYAATPASYKANQYLAQLAVNIVDYIDQDDYSTPFNWTASDYVSASEPVCDS